MAIPTPAGTRSTWGASANGPRPPRPANHATAQATTASDHARPAQARRDRAPMSRGNAAAARKAQPRAASPMGPAANRSSSPQPAPEDDATDTPASVWNRPEPPSTAKDQGASNTMATTVAPNAVTATRPAARNPAEPCDTTLPSARPSATTSVTSAVDGATAVTNASSRPRAKL